MLDIISMITLFVLFIILLIVTILLFIIIVDNEERIYNLRKNNKNIEEEQYTWKQVEAYSIIALHNLLNSANEVNLKNMKMFIEPLKELHQGKNVVEFSRQLIKNVNK